MHRLIRTRNGGVAYVFAPWGVLLLLVAALCLGVKNPFSAAPDWRSVMFMAPTALMAFALPALIVLARWCLVYFCGGRDPRGVQCLLCIPAALVMWIPAGLLCLPLYALNLVCLARRRYPAGPPLRWKPVVFLILAIFAIGTLNTVQENHRRSQPTPTALEAYGLYVPGARVLAEIPQGEDATLIISESGSGVFARTADGWILRTPYQTDVQLISDVHAVICRNPAAGEDVVILSRMSWDSLPATAAPTDTAGSVFTVHTEAAGPATRYVWYAIVDVDVPGYDLALE